MAAFSLIGTSGGITTYVVPGGAGAVGGVITSLTYDGTEFVEHATDGSELHYQAQGVSGGNPVKHDLTRIQGARDARGFRGSAAHAGWGA